MRVWSKAIAAIAAIALLIWLLVMIGGFTMNILNAFLGGDSGEHDPMFAEEIQMIAPTPEPEIEENPKIWQDNSANWDTSVQTPVDRTADELANESQGE